MEGGYKDTMRLTRLEQEVHLTSPHLLMTSIYFSTHVFILDLPALCDAMTIQYIVIGYDHGA